MLSRFFNKSKPVHYLIVGSILLIVFALARFVNISENFTFNLIAGQLLLFGLCLITIFLFDFLTSKNKLTKKNSYDILMFTLFIALLPQTILDGNILISHFFILLAMRRIISLRSKKDLKKKLLDAALWVGLATLFYFWSSLFFLLIFIALIFYSIGDLKNWIVPFIGITCIFIICTAYLMLNNEDIFVFYENLFDYSFDFSSLNDLRLIIGLTLLLSYGNWALFFYIRKLRSKNKNYRPAFIIIVFSELIALLIVAFAPNKNGSEFIFLFAPLAIIMTNYLENIREKWFKEILIWALMLTPIITFFI